MQKQLLLFFFFFIGLAVICFGQNNRIWASYYGGEGDDLGSWWANNAIATDNSGNIYLADITNSETGIAYNGFKDTLSGANDAFLVKLDSSGNRIWATYYGGTGDENGWGQMSVAVDGMGNVYLTGTTASVSGIAYSGFQMTHGGGVYDAFLVKFDSNGNRLWATYYGGSGDDYCNSITTDLSGNVYISGTTNSQSDIAYNGFQTIIGGGLTYGDAFLVKFDSSGNRIWATYYGSTGFDLGYCVATDTEDNVYIGGRTNSQTNITSDGFQNIFGGGSDAFLVKFSSSGQRIWATYYGGLEDEHGLGVDIDNLGNVYLTGMTSSTSGIADGGFQNLNYGVDAFLVKFDMNCNRLWGTYYGGSGGENGTGVTVGSSGNVFLTGWSDASAGIAFHGFQETLGGSRDAFLAQFSSSGERLSATYYGGVDDDYAFGVVIDMNGNIYLRGATESIENIASGGFQNTFGGGQWDAFVVKFKDTLNLSVSSIHPVCYGDCNGSASATAFNGVLPYSYLWEDGQTTQTIEDLCAGNYNVMVTDGANNSVISSVNVSQGIGSSVTITQSGDTLYASDASNYQWYLNDTLIPGANSQTYVITEGGNYYVISHQNICEFTSNAIETTCLCTGVSEHSIFQAISIFPNPANEVINITVQLSFAQSLRIKIMDAFGQMIWDKEEKRKSELFNWQLIVSEFAAGTYFVNIQVENGLMESKKLIIY